MSQPATRITGSRLPAYFNGHHRSVYLSAFGRTPEPVELVSRPTRPNKAQQSASSVREERTATVLAGTVR